jgi:hypothetical protein
VEFPHVVEVSGGIETYRIFLLRTGSAIYWINTSPGIVLSALMERQ